MMVINQRGLKKCPDDHHGVYVLNQEVKRTMQIDIHHLGLVVTKISDKERVLQCKRDKNIDPTKGKLTIIHQVARFLANVDLLPARWPNQKL